MLQVELVAECMSDPVTLAMLQLSRVELTDW